MDIKIEAKLMRKDWPTKRRPSEGLLGSFVYLRRVKGETRVGIITSMSQRIDGMLIGLVTIKDGFLCTVRQLID